MNGNKILITGASGMLGSTLLKYLHNDSTFGIGSELDISSQSQVIKKLSEINPNIIIHTAAYTDVDGCELNPDKAYHVNAIGTQNLVNYCIGKNILFVYISSTGIYGVSKNVPFTEFDDVHPTTIHHRSKYEGEKIVRNHLQKYLIVRTGWLYGGAKTLNKNFVYKRFLEGSEKDTIYSDNSQIGNPTYVIDLVKQLQLLIERELYGIFNCVNNAQGISRYDYVKKIIELFDLKCTVQPAPTGMFTRVAKVSPNESAINYKLNLLNLNIMEDWEKSLSLYVSQLKKEL